jgi:hypothetical protein
LLRGDFEARQRGYQTAVLTGWMSRAEVRELENLNPAPAEAKLDEFLVPGNELLSQSLEGETRDAARRRSQRPADRPPTPRRRETSRASRSTTMLSTLPAVFNGPPRRAQRRAPNLRIVKNEADRGVVGRGPHLRRHRLLGRERRGLRGAIKALDVETLQRAHQLARRQRVFEGLAIANALREHSARVVTHIDGLAASIASIIALAGAEIRMSDNAFFMIHDPWTIVVGNASEIRKQADVLEKIGGSLLNEYVKRTGESKATVRDWMAAETWFDAQEALDAGFVDAIDGDRPSDDAAPQDLFDSRFSTRTSRADSDAERDAGAQSVADGA